MVRLRSVSLLLVAAGLAAPLEAQTDWFRGDTVIAAGPRYAADWFHRFLLGGHYRKLWTTPVPVPVLDLSRYAGGLHPDKVGGGMQTRTLRFTNPRDLEYVFRPLRRDSLASTKQYWGTIIEDVLQDAIAAQHPGGAIVAGPIMDAVGVLHPHPRLAALPDDPALGEFQAEFAGRMGMIEEHPNVPDRGLGFAGAGEILGSEELLPRLDAGPADRVDVRALLTARLVDMLINDWDRHPGQWDWARGGELGDSLWEPIAKDRDRALVSYSGLLPGLARFGIRNVIPFKGATPNVRGLVVNSLEFDRRLLVALERTTWDSVTESVLRRITDQVIDSAFGRLPRAYRLATPALIGQLKVRRDSLGVASARFYDLINRVADIHATDQPERARITPVDDSTIRVQIQAAGAARPWFDRHFRAGETREIRVYLHGGDDEAVVDSRAARVLAIRVIGGEGDNHLEESGSAPGRARFYDRGLVDSVNYGPDTLFDRRPWTTPRGKDVPPGRDYGSSTSPILSLYYDENLGVVPRLGAAFYTYGFRHHPYASRTALHLEHATRVGGVRLGADFDKRLESSLLHWGVSAGMSDLEVIHYHGQGNQTRGGPGPRFDVDQRQWTLRALLGYQISSSSDLRLGPVVKYSTTELGPGSLLDSLRPYGSSDFGQAGMALQLVVDHRDDPAFTRKGVFAEVEASVYPGLWDVRSTFGRVSAVGLGFVTVALPLRPVIALRLHGERVLGDFPFHESAFLGGAGSVRNLDHQRYAGDAALDGTAELRLRLARLGFVLPLDLGAFGLYEAGRVYVDGKSPGGWHDAVGGGIWVGLPDPTRSISISYTSGEVRQVFIRAGLSF